MVSLTLYTITCSDVFIVPVLDGTCHFQGDTKLVSENLLNMAEPERWCPRYDGEPPRGSLVAIYHTATLYRSLNSDSAETLSLNLHAVVVLGLPDGHLHEDAFYQDRERNKLSDEEATSSPVSSRKSSSSAKASSSSVKSSSSQKTSSSSSSSSRKPSTSIKSSPAGSSHTPSSKRKKQVVVASSGDEDMESEVEEPLSKRSKGKGKAKAVRNSDTDSE